MASLTFSGEPFDPVARVKYLADSIPSTVSVSSTTQPRVPSPFFTDAIGPVDMLLMRDGWGRGAGYGFVRPGRYKRCREALGVPGESIAIVSFLPKTVSFPFPFIGSGFVRLGNPPALTMLPVAEGGREVVQATVLAAPGSLRGILAVSLPCKVGDGCDRGVSEVIAGVLTGVGTFGLESSNTETGAPFDPSPRDMDGRV